MTVGVAAALQARCAPYIHALFVAVLLFLSSPASAQTTLNAVKARALLNCGANGSLPGFGAVDAKGRWTGFDVDYCRAVAAAIFDDANRVAFVPLATKDRFTALQSGDVDVLVRNTTWTSSRDTALGLQFTGVNFYDHQAFLVPKSLQVKSAVGLSNVSVCVQRDTTTEENLADFFRAHELKLKTLVFRTAEAAIEAYDSGRCDAYADDASGIRSRMRSLTYPDQHEILGDVIAKEPLSPAVRHGDDQWFDIVKWVHFALLNAEELGVTAANADEQRKSNLPSIQRLLGTEGRYGEALGLTNDWAYRIVRHVGNYGELFERNVGQRSHGAIYENPVAAVLVLLLLIALFKLMSQFESNRTRRKN